ncbi:MAG: MFS transporter [Melioribacteraceae bacterium]|nr:MFS transporter [Melioribacteraceae bacterium]
MKNKASLSIIFLTVFIDLMGFGILIPILPTFASKDLGISDFGIGLIVAIYSLMQFFFNPLLGRLSDRIGRRPVILVTQLLTVASYLMFSFSNSFLILFLSRLLAGLGGSNIGVAQAYIADITSKEERSKGMGIIGAAFGLGFVFGPLIGALLSKYGYHIAGYGSAAFSFLAFVFALFMLPESNQFKKTETKFQFRLFDLSYTKKIIAHPTLGFVIILFFIIIFSMANIYGTFALLGYKVYHFTDQQTGLLFGISGIIGASIQGGFMRILSNKFSYRNLVLAGSFFMMIGLGFLPYGVNFLGVAIVISILSIGTGILQPTILSMISRYAPENEQGSVLGINQSFSAFARVLGPLWGGFAYDFFGYQFPFLTGAAFTFFTFLLAYFLLKSERLPETKNV